MNTDEHASHRPALIMGGTGAALGYREFIDRSRGVARFLRERGLGESGGDNIYPQEVESLLARLLLARYWAQKMVKDAVSSAALAH